MLFLHAVTLFLSALLLFLVQPIMARQLLPQVGGAPAVWNTCMAFFQAGLLLGYLYAHVAPRWLGVRRHLPLHALVLIVPLAVLPLALRSASPPPSEAAPILWLLVMLTTSVGLPFLVVSTTAPLVQRWFAESGHRDARDPYFLYAASNLGSLVALLGFPLVVEPVFTLAEQSRLWSGGYIVLALLTAGCALVRWRAGSGPVEIELTNGGADEGSTEVRQGAASGRTGSTLAPAPINARRRLMWIAWSFVPSSWLLGATTHLTTDIAPVPLLWIVPLAIYLLSFVLVFARRNPLRHEWMTRLLPVAALGLVVAILGPPSWPVFLWHLAALFVAAMACHGTLAADRPHPTQLTEYYFWMSLGGVLGGVFNGLLAPALFPWMVEYPLVVALACLLCPPNWSGGPVAAQDEAARKRDRVSADLKRKKPGGRETARSAHSATASAAAEIRSSLWIEMGGALAMVAMAYTFREQLRAERPEWLIFLLLAVLVLVVVARVAKRPALFAALIGLALVADRIANPEPGELLFSGRGYFGMHRVLARGAEGERYHHLFHGTTVHGRQSHDPARRCEPLTYYHPTGPAGQLFAALARHAPPERVALVGLGTGALASYAQEGSEFVFFELDPIVRRVAEDGQYFDYLARCGRGRCRVELGDGRLKLQESADGSYDLIVLDAFSSDAVPIHLLTREALALYLRKCTDRGVLLFHTSNNHLDIEGVLADLAADAQLVALAGRDLALSEEQFAAGKVPSGWLVMAREEGHLGSLINDHRWTRTPAHPARRVWTDDYSNIIGAMK